MPVVKQVQSNLIITDFNFQYYGKHPSWEVAVFTNCTGMSNRRMNPDHKRQGFFFIDGTPPEQVKEYEALRDIEKAKTPPAEG